MRSALIAILSAMMVTPAAVHAEVGNSSAGSMTIRVEIPPFAAALQAQSEGAVGIASVVDTKSALMVSIPSTISSAQGAGASVYHGSDAPVVVATQPGSQITLTPSRSSQLNGMVRESFDLVPLSSRAEDVTLLIKPV
ncbi:MAG TPA: hypothetical protein VF503_32600 [Sphingobium sp.]|uniref:hypothetical protein n=1 Tax=Sphingobium sp. TaxID=1912891 RepID=UPI002ED6238E